MEGIIEINLVTGNICNVKEHLTRSLAQYISYYKHVKVGVTCREAKKRFDEHLKYKNWKKCVVKYKTSSKKNAGIIEKFLIKKYKDYLDNLIGGGGGLSDTGWVYYVYVLIR